MSEKAFSGSSNGLDYQADDPEFPEYNAVAYLYWDFGDVTGKLLSNAKGATSMSPLSTVHATVASESIRF